MRLLMITTMITVPLTGMLVSTSARNRAMTRFVTTQLLLIVSRISLNVFGHDIIYHNPLYLRSNEDIHIEFPV